MIPKSNFIKLLDRMLEVNGQYRYFTNLDYSLKAKSSYIFLLQKSIKDDCKNLIDIWEKGFDFGSVSGASTKYEPKNSKFKKWKSIATKGFQQV